MPNPIVNRRVVLSGAVYDPDAQLYFSQLNPQPSASYKSSVNRLIRKLKSDGNWILLDRLWIHATEHQQNARISLVNPTSTAITEVNAPTWTARQGYTGNGTTQYLNSNYNPATDAVQLTLNSNCFGAYERSDSNTNSVLIGENDATNFCRIFPRAGGFQSVADFALSGTNMGAVANSVGHWMIRRVSDVSTSSFKNVVLLGSSATASSAIGSQKFYILANNNNGVASNFRNTQVSYSYFGSGTVNEVTFNAALSTFQSAIGF